MNAYDRKWPNGKDQARLDHLRPFDPAGWPAGDDEIYLVCRLCGNPEEGARTRPEWGSYAAKWLCRSCGNTQGFFDSLERAPTPRRRWWYRFTGHP